MHSFNLSVIMTNNSLTTIKNIQKIDKNGTKLIHFQTSHVSDSLKNKIILLK